MCGSNKMNKFFKTSKNTFYLDITFTSDWRQQVQFRDKDTNENLFGKFFDKKKFSGERISMPSDL